MLGRFIVICYLFYLCINTTTIGQLLQCITKLSGNPCNFDVSLIYSGTSLLRQRWNLSNSMNYHKSNQPTIIALSDKFNGFEVNFYNALLSISRYDDLKCIPRIICEVASGKSPGEYRRAFGKSIFTEWLSGLDIAATSPILYLARAAVLGYSSKEDPTMCYRAFPRCPRNPDKLVNYLNNHNGGFFRFFNRVKHGSYERSLYTTQDNRETQRETLLSDYGGIEADNIGTLKLKFNTPSVLTLNQDHGRTFFPREAILSMNSKKIVFPIHDLSTDEPSKNKISKSLSKLQETTFSTSSQNSPLFFPRVIFP